MLKKGGYMYILTNIYNTVLYVSECTDLIKRVHEHKGEFVEGLTKKYNVNKLVYYEIGSDPENAIVREKQVKGGSRKKKIALIESVNPEWKDLFGDLFQ